MQKGNRFLQDIHNFSKQQLKDNKKVIKVRTKVYKLMLLFLYFMTAVTLYSLINDAVHVWLYSDSCHPTRISPEWDSFFIMLKWLISD